MRSLTLIKKILNSSQFSRKYKDRVGRRASRKLRNSATLVWIVVTHTVLATPGNIIFIYSTSAKNHALEIGKEEDNEALVTFANIAFVLYVISHAINHILYCLTNKQIQEETSSILFNCKNMYWSRLP
jgi:hypothetical protein